MSQVKPSQESLTPKLSQVTLFSLQIKLQVIKTVTRVHISGWGHLCKVSLELTAAHKAFHCGNSALARKHKSIS